MSVSLKSTLALALALLLSAMLPAVAQNARTVHGKVSDEAGEPLMGAAVLLQGTTRGGQMESMISYTQKQLKNEECIHFLSLGAVFIDNCRMFI